MAAEAVALVAPSFPRTAWLFSSPHPLLDSGQFCHSWCLHNPEWLCLAGLGILHSWWAPDLSLFLPPSLFKLFCFHPHPLGPSALLPPSLNFCSSPRRRSSPTDSRAVSDTVRPAERCRVAPARPAQRSWADKECYGVEVKRGGRFSLFSIRDANQ